MPLFNPSGSRIMVLSWKWKKFKTMFEHCLHFKHEALSVAQRSFYPSFEIKFLKTNPQVPIKDETTGQSWYSFSTWNLSWGLSLKVKTMSRSVIHYFDVTECNETSALIVFVTVIRTWMYLNVLKYWLVWIKKTSGSKSRAMKKTYKLQFPVSLLLWNKSHYKF